MSGKPTPRKATVPQLWFVLVLSYASAVTFLLIYLLTQSQYGKPSNLESLPDVVPELTPTGQVKQKFVDPRAPMPAGHTLALGESRRFGDLIVTPLRVVREPVEFTHFDDPKKTRPPGEAVLKLWVRLENASSSQAFPPLGKEIVFNRYRRPGEAFQELSNNFVASLENKAKGGPLVLIYPHVVQDVWDLKGQDVGHVLKPGESFETYLPSDTENLNSLSGELVWRIHFRKGLNAKSKRGVTTIVEVSFQGSDIQGGGSKG